jgi:hypothetical protein
MNVESYKSCLALMLCWSNFQVLGLTNSTLIIQNLTAWSCLQPDWNSTVHHSVFFFVQCILILINFTVHHKNNFIDVNINLSYYSMATCFNHITVILRLTVSIKMCILCFSDHKTHFFSWKSDLNSTCVLYAEGKYLFPNLP